MKISEVYNSSELCKCIIETTTVDWKEVTYYWTAKYARKWYSNDDGFSWPDDFSKAIWRIRRSVYDPNSWEYDFSYPEWNVWFEFKWSEKESYNYEWWPIPYLSLEDWDSFITTEQWDYIIIL